MIQLIYGHGFWSVESALHAFLQKHSKKALVVGILKFDNTDADNTFRKH